MGLLTSLFSRPVGVFKAALEYSAAHGLRDSLAREVELAAPIRATYDGQEGRRSFHEKRAPIFRGR